MARPDIEGGSGGGSQIPYARVESTRGMGAPDSTAAFVNWLVQNAMRNIPSGGYPPPVGAYANRDSLNQASPAWTQVGYVSQAPPPPARFLPMGNMAEEKTRNEEYKRQAKVYNKANRK